MRDHVRVTPGTRSAGSALPQEKEFDDAKLLQLLQSSSKELQGMRLVHLHLSILDKQELSDGPRIQRLLGELGANAAHLQMFDMSNSDLIMLYKGLKFSAVEETCKKIEALLLSKAKLTGPNPYKEMQLYSILELSLAFVHVIRYCEGLAKADPAAAGGGEAKPAIVPEELAKIDKSLRMFDLSPFLFNQAVINIRDETDKNKEYFELYISIKELQTRLSPDFDLLANRWLFNHFTSSLDRSLLRSLNHGLEFMGSESIGININLSTALSADFQKFDERLPAAYRGKVILEINKSDLMEHLHLYRELLDFAQKREYRICLDGLDEFWLTQFDVDALGADYAKIFWSNNLITLESDDERTFLDRVARAREGNCKLIMARCTTVTGLLYAHKHGIDFVQGFAIDAIMRKGMRITDAVKTAAMMDD